MNIAETLNVKIKMPIHVSLDSSALHSFDAAFNRLQLLVSEEIVKVYISEIVQREISSQLKVEFNEKVKDCEVGLRKVLRHEWLRHVDNKDILENAYKIISQVKEGMDGIGEKGTQEIFQSVQAEVLSVQPPHSNLVINAYFAGTLPFKHIKNREDFPDAFIFETVKDLKERLGAETPLHFVVADKLLRDALSKVEGIIIHKDLREFVQCDDVENLAQQNELGKLWSEMYNIIFPRIPELENTFKVALNSIYDELTGKEVEHPNIPDDNQEARISGVYEPEEVAFDWEMVENYGAGLITIPFELNVTSEIEFYVFRGDAFDLPEGVWVEHKDPETYHYFDAGGTVDLAVKGTVSVQFEVKKIEADQIQGQLDDLVENIQINKITDIEVLDKTGNIFI